MTPLRVGVVGAGNIATSRHLPVFQNMDRIELSAIYDRNPETARHVGSEYDIHIADSFDDLCAQSDLISLCTPPSTHCTQAMDAVKAGCHVLTEKPMAMSTAEADRMVTTASEHNRILSVVHNFLFMDAIQNARQLVEADRMGDVVRTYMVKPESEQKRGKAYLSADATKNDEQHFRLFWDEAAHLIYLTREFTGELAVTDAQLDTTFGSKGVIRARFRGDADGNLTMILDAPISEWWFAIFCDRGLLLVDIYRDICLQFDAEPDHSATQVLNVLLRTITQLTAGGLRSGLGFLQDRLVTGHHIPDAGFTRQVNRLVDAIETGSPPPVTATDGKAVIKTMEGVVRTAEMPGGPNYESNS